MQRAIVRVREYGIVLWLLLSVLLSTAIGLAALYSRSKIFIPPPETLQTTLLPTWSDSCPVTPTTTASPPSSTAASFAQNWYKSPDGQIWASKPLRWMASGNKVLWGKPIGSELQASVHRLDGAAPPIQADVSCCYADFGYQASAIYFPTAGCWEIEGRVAGSVFHFVVKVYPRFYGVATGRCANLADVVENSDAILLAESIGSDADRAGFIWQTIQVKQVWTGAVKADVYLDILQDAEAGQLLQRGQLYLLFLQSRPGYPWRVFCSQRTLTRVTGEQVRRLPEDPQDEALWSGDTLAAVRAQIQPLLSGTAPVPSATPRP